MPIDNRCFVPGLHTTPSILFLFLPSTLMCISGGTYVICKKKDPQNSIGNNNNKCHSLCCDQDNDLGLRTQQDFRIFQRHFMNCVISFVTIGNFHHGSQRQKNQFICSGGAKTLGSPLQDWIWTVKMSKTLPKLYTFLKTIFIPQHCWRSYSL